MLGWKLAFNNISILVLDKEKKKDDELLLQFFIFLSDIFLFLFLPIGYN